MSASRQTVRHEPAQQAVVLVRVVRPGAPARRSGGRSPADVLERVLHGVPVRGQPPVGEVEHARRWHRGRTRAGPLRPPSCRSTVPVSTSPVTVVAGRLGEGQQGAAAADLDVVRMRADAQDVEPTLGGQADHEAALTGTAHRGVRARRAPARGITTGTIGRPGSTGRSRHTAHGLTPLRYCSSRAVRSFSVSIGAQNPS